MARKPAALSKKEDIEAVPIDQEVVIDTGAPDDPIVAIEPDDAPPPEKKEPTKRKVEEPDDVADLKKQLADLKLAEEASRAQLQRDLDEARKQARELEARGAAQAATELELQLDAVENAIAAAESEAASAQQMFAQAAADGEYQKQADAQLKLSRAAARLESLESGKQALEGRIEQAKKAPVRTESSTDPFEANIANLPDAAKTWLRGHRDYMTDARKNAKIQAAHWDTLDAGHQAYSPAYFEALEINLGLKQKPDPDVDDDPPEPRSRTVSAPVHRDPPSPTTGRPVSNRITLTAEQREIARASMPHLQPGEAEKIYAQNLIKLNGLKQAGHYSER